MVRAVLLFSLLALPEPSCPANPERVFMGAVVSDVDHYFDRVVEVCGLVQRIGDIDPRERVMYDRLNYSRHWMYVFNGDNVLPPEGSRACVIGTYRRRDGYSPADARARGLPDRTVTDNLQRPDYVFYPVQCGNDGPALG